MLFYPISQASSIIILNKWDVPCLSYSIKLNVYFDNDGILLYSTLIENLK